MLNSVVRRALVLLLAIGSVARADPITIVTLDRQPQNDGTITPQPLLPRELFRQALLIAARDELGAATRDEVLGEPTDRPAALHLIPVMAEGPKQFSVKLVQAGQTEPIWTGSLAIPLWSEQLADASVDAETLSRGSFVTLLKQHGVSGPANKTDPQGQVDPDAATQLDHLELFSQLTAIRLLHAEIHDKGESPYRLAALARGYANFSSLSRFIWSGESRAAAARALLYGQRAVAKFPDDPIAWYGRIYARALAGLPKAALDDLATVSAKHPNADRVVWVELARALSKYDVESLLDSAQKEPASAPLATYFAFLTVQNSGAQAAVLNFAEAALQKSPDCQQLISRIDDDTGPGVTHAGGEVFGHTLAGIDTLPGMAPDIVQLLPELRKPGARPNGRLAIIDALHKDGDTDRGEPSWHTTARLIEDVTFMNCQTEAMHITFKLGQSPTDFVQQIWPLVEKHRYVALMEGYRNVATGGNEAVLAGMAKTKIDDPTLISMGEISQYWLRAPNPVTDAGVFRLMQGTDAIAPDEELKAQVFQFAPVGFGAIGFSQERLEKLCPDSPLLMAAKIKQNWEDAEPHLNEWLQQVGDHPSVTLAASQAYLREGKNKEAADMLERYLAVSPDSAGFDLLADCYLKQHDEKNWLATLNRGLQQPAAGLEHAKTNKRIAKYLIAQKRYTEALPYAEASGESYSAWGLDIAAAANEKLGNWDRAETLMKAKGENYDQPTDWLEWCVRTDHGDLAGAKAHAAEGIAANADHTDRESQTDRILYSLLIEKWDDAEGQAATTTEELADPWAGLHGIMLAYARHDDKARAQFLDWILDPAHPFTMPDGSSRPQLTETAELIKAMVKAKATKFDPAQVTSIADHDSLDAPNVYYFVGRYAEIGGQTEQAKAFYEKSLACEEPKSNKALAAARLRAIGLAPATQP